MVSKLPHPYIPYVQVIRNKRELGGIYNNLSFVVTFVDVILTCGYAHRFLNVSISFFSSVPVPVQTIQISVCLIFHESHVLYVFSTYLADEHKGKYDLCPGV